ncbi:TOBE domain-containing protein [Ursidibacter sp. B-7004-1]
MMNTEILLTIKLQQELFVDPKRIRLLKAIQQTGSINQAAKNANVSYKSAWDHLETMNTISPKPLLDRNTGGKNGGGTQLTPYAERLLQLYELLAQTQEKAFQILQDEKIPLDSVLSATARFSPQSSARNQLFGKVIALQNHYGRCDVSIEIANFPINLTACITPKSATRLQLSLGKEVMLMIKAPWVNVHSIPPQNIANLFPAKVTQITSENEVIEIALIASQTECFATVKPNAKFKIGQEVWVSIEPEQIVLLSL